MFRSLLLILLLPAIPNARADWPIARGNPAMTGAIQGKLPDKLVERWKFETKGLIETTPAIVDGVAFIASADKNIYAVDMITGKLKWKRELGILKASPGVFDGRLYVGDMAGKVHALKASTGEELWTFETGAEIHACPNFHGEHILIGSHDTTLYCLDKTGKKVWEYKIDAPVNGSAVVVGDRVMVAGCDSVLHVVDATTGKGVGKVEIGGQAAATAAILGDRAYVGTMADQVLAIDWKKQKKEWEFEAKKRKQPFFGSCAVVEKCAIAGSRDKKIYALNPLTGKELWSFTADGAVDASPVVVGERVYVGSLSDAGDFYVIELATGKELQHLTLDAPVSGSVAVGPDCIVVGTEKGTVWCLGEKKAK